MNQQEAWSTVGANVRRLRTEKSMTQTELARLVGVTAARISQIEHGVKDCTVGLLADIASALDEPMDMLFRMEKTRRPAQPVA